MNVAPFKHLVCKFTYTWTITHSLEPPFHGYSTDVPPAPIQAACSLLDGLALRLCSTGITVMQQHLAQVQYGRHTCAVLLNVPLQILHRDGTPALSFCILTAWKSEHACLKCCQLGSHLFWLSLFNASLLGRKACGHSHQLHKYVSSRCIIRSKINRKETFPCHNNIFCTGIQKQTAPSLKIH